MWTSIRKYTRNEINSARLNNAMSIIDILLLQPEITTTNISAQYIMRQVFILTPVLDRSGNINKATGLNRNEVLRRVSGPANTNVKKNTTQKVRYFILTRYDISLLPISCVLVSKDYHTIPAYTITHRMYSRMTIYSTSRLTIQPFHHRCCSCHLHAQIPAQSTNALGQIYSPMAPPNRA